MVYLLVEEAFTEYPWCQRTLRGIYEEGRKKRTAIQELKTPEEAEDPCCVLLAGASRGWINQMTCRSRRVGLHPIVLSNQMGDDAQGKLVSKVTMDIHNSMELAVEYLYSLGRTRLALYGVNPTASSDPWRAARFQELTGRPEDIFSLAPTIDDCFRQFQPMMEQFDGVICASDYAAVSLVRRLEDMGYAIPEKLYIVGYGDMHLSRQCKPSITSISDDYENFGRAALAICGIVERNETIASVRVNIRSKLHIRQSTENRPFQPLPQQWLEEAVPKNLFFADPEISTLARVESLLRQLDETDHALLRLLMADVSYAEMAQSCFISETAAKYRLKKMKTLCGVKTRAELASLLEPFF